MCIARHTAALSSLVLQKQKVRKGPRIKGPRKGPRKDVEGRSDANAATIGHQHRAAREAAVLVAETADAATPSVLDKWCLPIDPTYVSRDV
jgi:hypothetical protein